MIVGQAASLSDLPLIRRDIQYVVYTPQAGCLCYGRLNGIGVERGVLGLLAGASRISAP